MDLKTFLWQSNLALLLFYSVYWLFLRRDTFFRWNRFYLLLAVVFALAFPFLPVPTLFQEAVPKDQVLLFFGEETPVYQVDKVETIAHSPTLLTWENALLALYALGVLFFFIRLIINLFEIFKLMFPLSCVFTRKAIAQGYFIVQTPPQTPIFSFLNILFWNENPSISETEKAKILAHELVHIRQWHSLDVLFVEIVAVFFWCNPIIWAYKKSLQSIHEYLADTKVLEKETSKTEYANLLVSQFLQTDTLHLTNSFFNKSLLKNRIIMLYRRKSTRKALAKFTIAVPMLILCLLVVACHKELSSIQIAQFNFVQGFELQEKFVAKNNKEVFVDFEENTTYMTRLSNKSNNSQGITIELYNSDNEQVATSYVNQRYFPGWTYKSKKAGKYRLLIKMNENAEKGTLVGVAKRVAIVPPKDRVMAEYSGLAESTFWTMQMIGNTDYRFIINNKNVYLEDVSIFVENADKKELPVKVLLGDKGIKMWDFTTEKEGWYKVIFQVKDKLSEGVKLDITLKDSNLNLNTNKSEKSPFSGLKEYDIPANKESEFTMILNKNITYEFKVIKGEAEIYIVSKDGKISFVSSDNLLLIKGLSEAGIYNMRVKSKSNTDAKVTFAVVVE
jgi:hypothetical protein